MQRLLIILLIIGLGLSVKAQTDNELYTRIAESCYKFRFHTADSLTEIFQKSHPGLDPLLLKANVVWWKIISGEDSPLIRKHYAHILDSAEQLLLKEPKTESDLYLYRAIFLYGYLARMDGLNKHYFKAFLRMRTCFKHLQKSFGREEVFHYFYLSSGMYNYHMGVASQHYPVLIPYLYFYPKGNPEKGMHLLEKAATHSNKLLNTEGSYFLMKIYLDEKRYLQALTYATKLVLTYPDNCLYLYYQFFALLQLNQVDEARKLADRIKRTAMLNTELSAKQKIWFTRLAEKDLLEYQQKKK